MDLRRKCRQWLVYLETVNSLNSCSDRSLDDLGIKRSEIRRVARQRIALL